MSTMTIIWLVIAIVMGVLEACTVQLVSLWFAIGGVAACITSLFTDKLTIQLIVFIVVTAIALAVTRPIVKRMKQKRPEATNADRYIGKRGVVLQDIDNAHADGQPIKEGEDVTVTAIEGVKLIVDKN